MPSPICTVQDGAGAPQSTLNGVNVTPGNTITVALASTAGVSVFGLSIVGQDDLVTPPAITINNTTKTATFTAPGSAPWTLNLQAQVNGGTNNGTVQPSYTTTFQVCALSTHGMRAMCSNEKAESNAVCGWAAKVNTIVRTVETVAASSGGGGAITAFGCAQGPSGDESTSSGTYVDLTTVGPSVTLTTGASVVVQISGQTYQSSSGNTGYISVAVSGATTIAASDTNSASADSAVGGFTYTIASVGIPITGLTPGVNTFTLKYRSSGGVNFTFRRRRIAVFAQ